MVVGCGGGKDDVSVAPPPPPSAGPGVTMTATPDPVAPATQAPGPDGVAAAQSPGQAAEATADQFKGMTAQQIEEFKATATPETHDMNLPILMEAVTGFMAEFKRAPANQEEMIKARYLQRVMVPPKGKRYVINPESGDVTAEAQ